MTEAIEREEHDHDITIIVNGRERTVEAKELSFDDVLKLAFDQVPSGPNWVFTVTYRRGPGPKPDGTLLESQVVKVKDGMIFNVTATDKS
jgi:hypothetical protein